MEKKMTQSEIIHDTFTLKNTYSAAPAEVFAAFAQIEKKKRWYADSDTYDVLKYNLDFNVGGKEVLVGKMRPSTPVAGAVLIWESVYADVKQDRSIIFSQAVDMNDHRISCAMITVEFLVAEVGCEVRLTHQAAFFEGSDGPEFRKLGWEALLNQLGTEL
jgi:uncharacterized protein YndB with AHSA1/START domain